MPENPVFVTPDGYEREAFTESDRVDFVARGWAEKGSTPRKTAAKKTAAKKSTDD